MHSTMNIQTLIDGLTLEDEADRIYAAEDLGYTGAAEAVAPLVERLATEPSRKVRETIFAALERMNRPEVRVHMAMLLDSDDAFLRNQAVALLQRSGAAAAPVLLARMSDADPDVRKFVLDTAAGIASPEVEPIYDAAMRDPDVNVLIAVLEYLSEQRKTRFKPAVEEVFLHAKEPMLMCAAFAALLQIGDTTSWQIIRQRYPTVANVPGWELGWWIRALGEFGGPGELEVFHEVLQNHDGKVIHETIDALERFQGRHGRVGITAGFWKLLQDRLEDDLPSEDKLQLLRVIGGFSATTAIGDYLVGLLEHHDRQIKLGAIEGIGRLGRPDLLALLQKRRTLETDAEIIEAIGDCERASR
jgi:HEAT repeat protein